MFQSETSLPLLIAPGTESEISFRMKTFGPGRYFKQVQVFVEYEGAKVEKSFSIGGTAGPYVKAVAKVNADDAPVKSETPPAGE